jgi:hypothetical protein
VSELADDVHEALRELAASDRSLKRFGVAGHRYQLAPALGDDVAVFEFEPRHEYEEDDARVRVPRELHEFAARVGGSGAGPGYGFLGVHRVVRAQPWRLGIAVAHLGCGYAAVVAVDDGQVWIDARSIGIAKPIAPTFTAWYLDWLARLASNVLPEAHVPPDACPLPNALSGFLGVREHQLGLAAGTLSGSALREALADLGTHSIEIAAESSVLFAAGTRVDPCIACARLVETLGADGLRPDVVCPGAAR